MTLKSTDSVEHAMTKGEYDRLRDSDPQPELEPVRLLLAAIADAPDESWRERAACRGAPLSIFYSDEAGHNYTEARAICRSCPVVDDCGRAGASEVYGVWGGTSPDDRRSAQWPAMHRHGHSGGRLAHQRRGEKPCDECAEAWRAYVVGLRMRRAS